MKHTGTSPAAAQKRSPLYTPPAVAAVKKQETKRDVDGAYRATNRIDARLSST